MTAPSTISDQRAREIAQDKMFALGAQFIATGEIGAQFHRWAGAAHAYIGAYSGDLHDPIYDLAAYVAHHGERGPVDAWSER